MALALLAFIIGLLVGFSLGGAVEYIRHDLETIRRKG